RSSTPYPCSGPSETAFRMRRSSVPGSKSACGVMVVLLTKLGESSIALLSCQGECACMLDARRELWLGARIRDGFCTSSARIAPEMLYGGVALRLPASTNPV